MRKFIVGFILGLATFFVLGLWTNTIEPQTNDPVKTEYAYAVSYADFVQDFNASFTSYELQATAEDPVVKSIEDDLDGGVAKILIWITAIIGIIEIVLRFYPTAGDNTILGNLLRVLLWLSNLLNNKAEDPGPA